MAVSNGYAQYQSNQITTAGPDKLLLMAYDGAIRFARMGQEKLLAGSEIDARTNLGKAQLIIAELMMNLDPEPNPELVANLARLYEYMHRRLTDAGLNGDKKAAEEVIGILLDLKDAWMQAAQSLREQTGGEGQLAA